MSFVHPQLLYFLFLIPVFLLLFILARISRKKALRKFGEANLLAALMPDVSTGRPKWKFFMLSLAFALIVITIAGPQQGAKLRSVKRSGVELMIALDVSNSMLAEDIKPSRMENAKLAISKMIDQLENDKVGLIVFAGDAYTQIPITTDYSAAKLFLNSVSTGIVSKQGTAIGSAIDLACKSFSPESTKGKAIILISDGENHEDDAIAMAKKAAENGIIVNTIGMGLADGAPIPVPGTNDFRKDNSGNVVVSKLDENLLQQVAATTEGVYVRAGNSQAMLKPIFEKISKMQKEDVEAKVYAEYESKAIYPALLALLILALEIFILDRKNRILRNIRLFKYKIQ
jgi:Ca-activated chloride channel homolog